MFTSRNAPLAALVIAGVLWGTTVPLTKIALDDMGPGWLAVVRFALAALPLAWIARRRLRAALSVRVAVWGALGYGIMLLLQNAGIDRTSVSHAALITGAAPVAVMALTVLLRRGSVRPVAWVGAAGTLCGVVMIAADAAGSASVAGDALVLVSVLLSAAFMVAQQRNLTGRDPLAVTAVQFAAAAVVAAPFAPLAGGPVPTPGGIGSLAAITALIVAGTIAPFALLAFAQSRVEPATAGLFLNIEPVVGAGIGVIAFGNPFGPAQVLGASVVIAGILLAAAPPRRTRVTVPAATMSTTADPANRHAHAAHRASAAAPYAETTPHPSTNAITTRPPTGAITVPAMRRRLRAHATADPTGYRRREHTRRRDRQPGTD